MAMRFMTKFTTRFTIRFTIRFAIRFAIRFTTRFMIRFTTSFNIRFTTRAGSGRVQGRRVHQKFLFVGPLEFTQVGRHTQEAGSFMGR